MSLQMIAENLARIEEGIAGAAARAGRPRSEITLIGVSKTHGAAAIREAYAAGVRHFGENRVQEFEAKRGEVESLPGAVWHLIGHLQSNKAGRAAKIFDCVDAVDDFALAERLRRAWVEARILIGAAVGGDVAGVAGASGGAADVVPADPRASGGRAGGAVTLKKLRVLIEVRLAEEETKNGVTLGELPVLAERMLGLEEIDLRGLMCIPPFFEDAELVRPYFRKLREARDSLAGRLRRELPVLSMGMSHDFGVAIEEGATEVRVGTALFGERRKEVMK